MGNKALSIEFGQQMTRICEVDYSKKNPHVYSCISFETPAGVVEDGFIHDKLALATVLREQLNAAGIKNDKVVFTISSTKIANREAVIPYVKNNQIAGIVNTNAKDYFPVNIDEYNITYSILEKINTKENKQIRILVLAAPAMLVKSYFELADMMNFHVLSIDYTGNSSYQLLRGEVNVDVNLIVQINDQNTIINLLENESLLLQRTLPYGASTITEAVISNEFFHVHNYGEAMHLLCKERIINEHFESKIEEAFTLEDISQEYTELSLKESAKDDVTSSLGMLLSNISRVIDYFVTKHPGKKIENIYITGEGSTVMGIEQLIKNELGFKVKLLNKLTGVTFEKTTIAIEQNQSVFLSCIGAAIAPIDFTPAEYTVKPVTNNAMLFPVLLLAISVIGAVGIYVFSVLVYKGAKTDLENVNQKIASIQDIKQIYSDYQKSENNLKNFEAFDASTKNASEHMLEFIAELEQKTPKGTTVKSIALQEGVVTIQATSPSKEELAKFVEMLSTFESLSSVSAGNYVETKDENDMPTVEYAIMCVFR